MKDTIGKKLLEWRKKEVIPHIQGKFLDIGCGTNEIVKAYSGEGVGVDVYPWENVDIVVKDTAVLPFENKAFDTVSIVAALNHIPNRKDVLDEVNRILKDDGKLIVTMIPPKSSKLWHTLRKPWDADQKERGMKEGEVYGMTEDNLRKLLSETGFEIEFKKKFMLGVNNLTIVKKKSDG